MDFLKNAVSQSSNAGQNQGVNDDQNAQSGNQTGDQDLLDKGVEFAQQCMSGGQQSNDSPIDQAKVEGISEQIRSGYKSATGKDFPIADK